MANPKTSWPLIEPASPGPSPVSPSLPSAIPQRRFQFQPFGYGLIRPFQRDQKGDFATAGDAKLVSAAIGQILGTFASSDFSQGEMPWRPEFGSLLYLLKHRPNTPALDQLAHQYVVQAIQQWERRVVVTDVFIGRDFEEDGGLNSLIIKVRFNFIDTSSGAVIYQDLETSIII
jgi:phage baseplate assembly protein W